MTNLVDIAATIRKHSPGVLPESLHTGPAGLGYFQFSSAHDGREKLRLLPNDIAGAVLRDAMTADIAPHAVLIRTADAYRLDVLHGNREGWFHDSDHGGSLGACYAAWCFAKGIACGTHPSA